MALTIGARLAVAERIRARPADRLLFDKRECDWCRRVPPRYAAFGLADRPPGGCRSGYPRRLLGGRGPNAGAATCGTHDAGRCRAASRERPRGRRGRAGLTT